MNNYLIHYGIKGMKWGVRRYQNEDGTLTEAGRRHYGYDQIEAMKRGQARTIAKMEKRAQKKVARDKRNYELNTKSSELRKGMSVADKFTYNQATARKAAEYMVDKGMKKEDAIKKAKKDAWRNVAITLGAYGAISIASAIAQNKANTKQASEYNAFMLKNSNLFVSPSSISNFDELFKHS